MLVTPTTTSFSISAVQPTRNPAAKLTYTVDHKVADDVWTRQFFNAYTNKWSVGAVDAATGAAIQARAEAFVAAHPQEAFSKFGIAHLDIATSAGNFSYPLASVEAKQLFDDVAAAAHPV